MQCQPSRLLASAPHTKFFFHLVFYFLTVLFFFGFLLSFLDDFIGTFGNQDWMRQWAGEVFELFCNTLV